MLAGGKGNIQGHAAGLRTWSTETKASRLQQAQTANQETHCRKDAKQRSKNPADNPNPFEAGKGGENVWFHGFVRLYGQFLFITELAPFIQDPSDHEDDATEHEIVHQLRKQVLGYTEKLQWKWNDKILVGFCQVANQLQMAQIEHTHGGSEEGVAENDQAI
jgi:hypothetical protein